MPFYHRLPPTLSREECNERMEKAELEKGDLPAMIIAAFLVFTPAIILSIGAIVVILIWFFLR